jgi:hypothetical protein
MAGVNPINDSEMQSHYYVVSTIKQNQSASLILSCLRAYLRSSVVNPQNRTWDHIHAWKCYYFVPLYKALLTKQETSTSNTNCEKQATGII